MSTRLALKLWWPLLLLGSVCPSVNNALGVPPATEPTLQLSPHPRLMLTDAEIPKLKARCEQAGFLKTRYQELLRSANGWLKKPIELPPRGGQWFHWYACKQDGGNLDTVSPTEHKCRVCGRVYSGWPYDDVVLMRTHSGLGNAIRDLGLAHRLTGEKKYADKAGEILLAYADKYTSYPLHDINGKERTGGGHVGPQTLDEAVWLIGVCQGADLVWDRLTAAQQERIESGLLRPAADTIRRHKMGIHNIQCWKNSAVGLVGLLLGDTELIADAVDSKHGFRQQIAQGINDDGQWYEGAWGYHFYTVNAMAPLVEAGERCGLGLYAYRSQGKSYRNLFEGPLNLAMPNRELPAFNDSSQVSLAGSANVFELALTHYGDPQFADLLRSVKRTSLEALLYGVEPLPESQVQESVSHNYPAAGYAVLQQGQGRDATWLCLKYGPHGGGHGHPDKLNFILYSRGKVLGFDPGTGKYGVPLHAGWQKTTVAHNTLTVDESNQKAATGRCLEFVSQPDHIAALADAGPIYDGVTYRRAVAVLGSDVVLVLDLVRATKEHTFDLAYHNTGVWASPPSGQAETMPDKPGYRYLEGMVQVTGPLPLIKQDLVQVGLAVAAAEGGSIWAGTGAGSVSRERVPCVILRTKGQAAVVGWALALNGTVPTVRVVPAGSDAMVEAEVGGKTYHLSVDPDGQEKLNLQ